MPQNVTYYPEKGCVIINKKLYTIQELEDKTKSVIELNVLHTLKRITKRVKTGTPLNQLQNQTS